VIVMVAASFEVARAIPLALPEAGTGESTGGTLVLSLDATGSWFLDGEPTEPDAVRVAVARARTSHSTVRATIAADEAVPHGHVIRMVDLLREERVTDFAFQVAPPGAGRGPS
jgi:biopolymer transport protein ExbD